MGRKNLTERAFQPGLLMTLSRETLDFGYEGNDARVYKDAVQVFAGSGKDPWPYKPKNE